MHHSLFKGTHRGRRCRNWFVFHKLRYVHQKCFWFGKNTSAAGLSSFSYVLYLAVRLSSFFFFRHLFFWLTVRYFPPHWPILTCSVWSPISLPSLPPPCWLSPNAPITTPNCLSHLLQPSPSMPLPPPAGSPARPPLSPLHCSQEDVKSLTAHIVENYWKALEDVDYVQTFKGLKLRYEQQRERQDNPKLDRWGSRKRLRTPVRRLCACCSWSADPLCFSFLSAPYDIECVVTEWLYRAIFFLSSSSWGQIHSMHLFFQNVLVYLPFNFYICFACVFTVSSCKHIILYPLLPLMASAPLKTSFLIWLGFLWLNKKIKLQLSLINLLCSIVHVRLFAFASVEYSNRAPALRYFW